MRQKHKDRQSIQWSKDSNFNKWCLENFAGTWEKKMLLYQLIPHTGINSKWMKDFNVSCETIKIGSKISDISGSRIFTYTHLRARKTKGKISGTTSNQNVFAQQRKPLTKWKGKSYSQLEAPLLPTRVGFGIILPTWAQLPSVLDAHNLQMVSLGCFNR